MRPNNWLLNPDVGLPAWLLALQQAIGDRDLRPSDEHLMPLAALAELMSLSQSPPDTADDSRSLQADLGHALDGLGAELMEAVCVAVDDFRRNTLGGLPQLLATRQGAEVAGTAAKTVSERLCGDEAVAAAWRDCVNPTLVEAWAAGREDAVNAIELARWERALAALPDDVFRVALGVRNLERTLPAQRLPRRTGQKAHWTEVVAYYLRDLWVWHTLLEDMRELQVHAVSPAEQGIPNHGNPDDTAISTFYAALEQMVGTDDPALWQMVEHAGSLRDLMPEGSSRHRLLAALAVDTADRDATLAFLARFEHRFDLLLARAARQRNAAVHGSVTVPAVIANVLRFSSSLGHRLVQEALAAAAAGESLLARLERERLIARERRAALSGGRTLSEVLRDIR